MGFQAGSSVERGFTTSGSKGTLTRLLVAVVIPKLFKSVGCFRSCCCSLTVKVLSSMRRMCLATAGGVGDFLNLPEKRGRMTWYHWGKCARMPGLTELVPNPSYLQ